MTHGVACSYRDCPNPVIGQCNGYRGPCGQFYCRIHSVGKLCSECVSQKAADDAAARRQQAADADAARRQQIEKRAALERAASVKHLYDEYILEINNIRRLPVPVWLRTLDVFAGIWGFYLISVILLALAHNPISAMAWFLALAWIPYAIGVRWLDNTEYQPENKAYISQQVSNINKNKPRFSEFYQAYLQAEEGCKASQNAEQRSSCQERYKAVLLEIIASEIIEAQTSQKS